MYTPIQLDKVRNFRYGMKALSLVEKSLNIKSISKLDFNNLSMEETATIIWAGLVHEDKKLTPDKVMDLIDEHSDVQTVSELMTIALDEAFSGKGEKEKN